MAEAITSSTSSGYHSRVAGYLPTYRRITKIQPNQTLIELASFPENAAVRPVTRDPPYLGGRWIVGGILAPSGEGMLIHLGDSRVVYSEDLAGGL
ncbi:hypothetical protein DRO64_08580 [Candidatus Bathyarchaeota archaeon]|nr:MAG: hypothetical protein DRO64_08580 [Candidatus Bathyarchaeota archaeon]